MNKQKIVWKILLHDIRSVQNVASIFRLADCLGCSEILLSGITPSPIDRFSRIRKDFAKISLGSENFVNWKRIGTELQSSNFLEDFIKTSLQEVLTFLENYKQSKNQKIICIEQSEFSVDYKIVAENIQKTFLENKENEYLIIFGREKEGIENSILQKADIIAEISQYGKKESLNLFSAASISLYRFFDF